MRSSISVMVIEDRIEYRNTITSLINNVSGMECVKDFEHCEAAIAALQGHAGSAASWTKPDVLLLDNRFPDGHISGVEAIGQLKALMPMTSVIMLTIADDAETIYAALQAGASGYLFKEVSLDQVIDAIRQAGDGGLLMPAIVANKVLKFFKKERYTDNDYNLSPREKDVLQEMADGFAQKEIARRLFIEASTVNSHISSIYRKLHVRCASAAVAKAIREGLIH